MGLIKAQCTNCGAALDVDNSKEAAICPFCNSAFIVEKAINQYITNNYIQGESTTDKQKNAIILLKQGNIGIVGPMIEELIKSDPTDYMNWYCLFYYKYKSGGNGNSIAHHLSQAIDVAPEDIKRELSLIKECVEIAYGEFPKFDKTIPIPKEIEDIPKPKVSRAAVVWPILLVIFGVVSFFLIALGNVLFLVISIILVVLGIYFIFFNIRRTIRRRIAYKKVCKDTEEMNKRALEEYNIALSEYNKALDVFEANKKQKAIELDNHTKDFLNQKIAK